MTAPVWLSSTGPTSTEPVKPIAAPFASIVGVASGAHPVVATVVAVIVTAPMPASISPHTDSELGLIVIGAPAERSVPVITVVPSTVALPGPPRAVVRTIVSSRTVASVSVVVPSRSSRP